MPRRMTEILGTETLVPVSILSFVVGGVFWLSMMYSDINHANAQIKALKEDLTAVQKDRQAQNTLIWENQISITQRLGIIEGKIDYIIKRVGE